MYGIDVLGSLLELHEYADLRIEHLFDACKAQSIEVIHFPIIGTCYVLFSSCRIDAYSQFSLPPDGETPQSLEETVSVVQKMYDRLHDGRNVLVHCKAGLGRTGT